MKKILLVALIILGFTIKSMAQNQHTKGNVELGNEATIESINAKIESIIQTQTQTIKQLESDNVNLKHRYENIRYSAFNEYMPIIVMIIIGLFIIYITYILSSNSYRKKRLTYDTILKCVETTGNVPDYFTTYDKLKARVVPIAGRVHLTMSILCGITGTIFMIVSISIRTITSHTIACGAVGVVFFILSILLFIKYSGICENSRKEQ